MTDDLAPDFAALADEARRLESRVVNVSTRTKDFKTVLIIETTGLTTAELGALSDAPEGISAAGGLGGGVLDLEFDCPCVGEEAGSAEGVATGVDGG